MTNGWFSIDPGQSLHFSGNLALFRHHDSGQADLVESRIGEVKRLEFFKLGDDRYACRYRQWTRTNGRGVGSK